MALVFREAHAAPDKKKINEEYFVLENTGGTAISTARLQVIASLKGKRGSVLGVNGPRLAGKRQSVQVTYEFPKPS